MAKAIKKPRSKTSKPPAIDKLLKPSIGIVLGLLGYFFLKGMKSEISRIDVSNEIQLREVLFGEVRKNTVITSTTTATTNEEQTLETQKQQPKIKNYVVLCHSDDSASEGSSKHLSSVFVEAKEGAYKELADFVLMDCGFILPSGKSIAERFDLDLKIRPTIFVSGKYGQPKQIPAKHLKTGPMLLKLLRQMIEPHPTKISSTKVLKASCLDKEYCAVLIKGGTPTSTIKSSIQKLMETYENQSNIEFASVDGTALAMTNLEEYQELVPKGKFQFWLFKKVSGGLKVASSASSTRKSKDESTEEDDEDIETTIKPQEKKQATKSDSRLISSTAIHQSEDFSYKALHTFLSTQMSSSSSLTKLSVLPAITTRTKKVEEASANKRNRILEQRQRVYDNQQNPNQEQQSSSTFSNNKHDERRADREQKRAEHNKEHNVKQRTPEELAERERSRRQRMEEEAAKWNIQEEEDGGSSGTFESDEQDLEEEMYLDGDEEEEEDVIDVDLDLD